MTVKELKQVLERLNVKVIDEQAVDKVVSSWFHRFGSAHVGSLNFDEFVAVATMFQGITKGAPDKSLTYISFGEGSIGARVVQVPQQEVGC